MAPGIFLGGGGILYFQVKKKKNRTSVVIKGCLMHGVFQMLSEAQAGKACVSSGAGGSFPGLTTFADVSHLNVTCLVERYLHFSFSEFD